MSASYGPEQYMQDLREIAAKETDPVRITEQVAPLARKLAKEPGWLRPEHRQCDEALGFGVHLLHEEPKHDLAVFVLSWLPNRSTAPHNHKTWAVVVGMQGQEQGGQLGSALRRQQARLCRPAARRGEAHVMAAGEVARCYPEHIYSVWNVGEDVSISLHTYGRHINYTGRSELDPDAALEKPFMVKVAGK